jgi:uncharacterized membrane protein
VNVKVISQEQRAQAAPVRVLLALAAILIFTLALAAPWMLSHGNLAGALLIRKFFSPLCHQDAMRSFWFWGYPAAVCARCLGIYLGAIFGVFARVTRKIALGAFAATLLANVADALTEFAGWHGSLPQVRFALGVMLGVSISALIASAAKSESPAHSGRAHMS